MLSFISIKGCCCIFSIFIEKFYNCWVGWLVVFYDTSTLIGYLMPNPVNTYILNMISKLNSS